MTQVATILTFTEGNQALAVRVQDLLSQYDLSSNEIWRPIHNA